MHDAVVKLVLTIIGVLAGLAIFDSLPWLIKLALAAGVGWWMFSVLSGRARPRRPQTQQARRAPAPAASQSEFCARCHHDDHGRQVCRLCSCRSAR